MTAWDNMQKAEAEAAIQKLVVCLFLHSGLNTFFFFFTLHSSVLAARRFDIISCLFIR
jgi:hypothetical protein